MFVAGVNTAILVTSSFTMHWALQSIKRGSRAGLQAGLVLTLRDGPDLPAHADARVLAHRLHPGDSAFGSIFYGLTGLHGAHVFVGLTLLAVATTRAFRGHFTPEHHHGVEIPGIYWHFVDVMWIMVYATVYLSEGERMAMQNPFRSEAEAFRFLLLTSATSRDRARRRASGRWPASSSSSC